MGRALAIAWLLMVGCGSAGETVPGETSTGTGTAHASASAVVSSPATAAAATASIASGAASSASAAPRIADPSHLLLKGDAKQGGLVFAKVDQQVASIEFPGHRAVVSDDGEFPIAFYRNAPKTETMKIRFKDGSLLEHVFAVEQRTYETDTIDGLPPKMVRLDPKDEKARAAAEARIDKVRMKHGAKNCYKDGFVWPTVGKVTSRYGQPRVLNDTDGGIHWGLDIAVPTGTPVKAPACGTVVFAEANVPLSGGTLVVDHGHGLTSTFIHLSAFSKKVGDEVKQGEVVASAGKSGRATGSHLHWGLNYFEIRVDPELLVPPLPAK